MLACTRAAPGFARQRLVQQRAGLGVGLAARHHQQALRLHEKLPGGAVGGRGARRPPLFGDEQLRLERADHLRGDAVEQREQALELEVEAPGPDVPAAGRLDELDVHAHPLVLAVDAALDEIVGAELGADPAQVGRALAQSEDAVARDHREPAEAAEAGDDLLDDPVGDQVVLRPPGEVVGHHLFAADRRIDRLRRTTPACC